MNIEIREDSVIITGYVNAVERYSKPIYDKLRGTFQRFVERIKSGAFKKALERNDNVLVLLNHDYNKQLASTKEGTALLVEDNIGLRATVTITDPETVQDAKDGKLVGWSFGFIPNDDVIGNENGMTSRTVNDLDLVEVSILNNKKSPAYNGTSIENRDGKEIEVRNFNEEANANDDVDYEQLAEEIANRVLDKLKPKEDDPKIDYSDFEKRLENI